MLLRSRALGHVLTEYVPLSLLRDIDEMAGAVRGQLIGLALPLGRLRWAARRQGWQLSVDHLRLHEDVLARPSMTLDEEALHRHAAGRVALPVEDVVAAVAALPEADPWHVIQGHDAVGLLVGLLKGRYGVTGTFGSTQLASALRAAFREDDLRASPLLAWVVAWRGAERSLVVLSVRPR
jgi:hypothetical protein